MAAVPTGMTLSPRTGAWTGLALVVIWAGLYLVAAVSAATSTYGYTITGNYLSDLGNPRAPAPWAFNAADILAGLLAIPFGLALGGALPRSWGRGVSAFVILGGIALMGVGVFPEESPYGLHGTFSLAFFLLLTIALGVGLKPFFASKTFRPVGAWVAAAAFVLNVILVAAWVVSLGSAQLAEHLGVYSALVWTTSTALHLWRAGAEAAQPRAAPA